MYRLLSCLHEKHPAIGQGVGEEVLVLAFQKAPHDCDPGLWWGASLTDPQ